MEIRSLSCKELEELLLLIRKGQWPQPKLTGKPKLTVVRAAKDKP